MAKSVYAADIKEGDQVDGVFLVDNAFKRTTKNKRLYLKFYLSDKSGGIEAVAWDEALEKNPDSARVKAGDFLSVNGRGTVNRYTNKVEIVVSEMRIVSAQDLDVMDFLPVTSKDVEALKSELASVISEVGDTYLRRLLENLFENQDFYQAFVTAPAAKNYHHAYLGGLLEHSVAVARLALLACTFYSEMDKSLLLTGALLHDVGKIKEFDFQRKIDYSTPGRLQGHIVLGNQIVMAAAAEIPDFPEDTKLALSHLILSHQGEPAFGAAVRPKTKEAVILSILDNADAKVNGFMQIAQRYDPETAWTDYQSMFEDYLYLTPRRPNRLGEQLKLVDE